MRPAGISLGECGNCAYWRSRSSALAMQRRHSRLRRLSLTGRRLRPSPSGQRYFVTCTRACYCQAIECTWPSFLQATKYHAYTQICICMCSEGIHVAVGARVRLATPTVAHSGYMRTRACACVMMILFSSRRSHGHNGPMPRSTMLGWKLSGQGTDGLWQKSLRHFLASAFLQKQLE